GEARLQSLREALEREKIFREQWRQAEVLFSRGQLPASEKILLELAGRQPHNSEVQALLETVRSQRSAAEEDQFYNRGRTKALRLVEEQQWDQAADLLRNLQSLFPNDPILQRDLQSVIASRHRHQPPPVSPAQRELAAGTENGVTREACGAAPLGRSRPPGRLPVTSDLHQAATAQLESHVEPSPGGAAPLGR